METIELYERVNHMAPVDTVTFISHLNATIDELLTTIDYKYVLIPDAVSTHLNSMDEGYNIYEEFTTPIIDNILFLITADPARKTDFVEHAERAYHRTWKKVHADSRSKRFVEGW